MSEHWILSIPKLVYAVFTAGCVPGIKQKQPADVMVARAMKEWPPDARLSPVP